MKKNILFAFLLISIVGVFAAEGLGQRILGGYKTVAKDDAGAVAAAEFALREQGAKTEAAFELGEILKAERQSVAGANYRLCMQVNVEGDEPIVIQAVVYVDLKGNKKLTSWAESTCGEGAAGTGGYTPVADPGDDAGVGLAADFAVKEQAAKTKTRIKLGQVMLAEDGEAKLGARNLRLCLQVSTRSRSSLAQAVVTMDQYSNLKLVSWTATNCSAG